MPKSSATVLPDSVSNAKDLKPYWNEVCAALSSGLWLPTATDGYGSGLSLSDGSSSATVEKSWFSVNLITAAQPTNWCRTFGRYVACLQADCPDLPSAVLKSRKIRLYPTAAQRAIFRRWLGTSRFVYNRTLEYLK